MPSSGPQPQDARGFRRKVPVEDDSVLKAEPVERENEFSWRWRATVRRSTSTCVFATPSLPAAARMPCVAGILSFATRRWGFAQSAGPRRAFNSRFNPDYRGLSRRGPARRGGERRAPGRGPWRRSLRPAAVRQSAANDRSVAVGLGPVSVTTSPMTLCVAAAVRVGGLSSNSGRIKTQGIGRSTPGTTVPHP